MTSLSNDDRLSLVDRLRMRYATGPMVNGEPEFGWRDFSGPAPEGVILPTPLMKEAADEIERLRKQISEHEKWLVERVEWLKYEMDHGGDWKYLQLKREETAYCLEKLRAHRPALDRSQP
jgi:hypothetical protein